MILLLGASGMLGRSCVAALSGTGAPMPFLHAPMSKDLDIRDELKTYGYITRMKPDICINCAAATNVDACELDTINAYRLNARAAESIAQACRKVRCRLVHVSTDYVFDGTATEPYTEQSATNPLQIYGKTKLEGEAAALDYGAIAVRVQWLFGRGKHNFVQWVVEAMQKGASVQVSADQRGSPTGTDWLARTLLLIANNPHIRSGLYHCCHDDHCTRVEYARHIVETLRHPQPDQIVLPVSGASFGKAARPVSTVMDCSKIRRDLGVKTLGSWRDDVASFVMNQWRLG